LSSKHAVTFLKAIISVVTAVVISYIVGWLVIRLVKSKKKLSLCSPLQYIRGVTVELHTRCGVSFRLTGPDASLPEEKGPKTNKQRPRWASNPVWKLWRKENVLALSEI
jgi:hypothetical protein